VQQRLYDNRQTLYKQGAVAAKDVDEAQVSLAQAKNQYESAQKQYDLQASEGQLTAAKGKSESAQAQLNYARIVSPIDGVVTDRPFNPGETPAAGAPLITVMNLSQVVARAHISPQEAAMMKAGDAATIAAPGQDEVKGQVTLVSPALDPSSTTVEIWVQALNPKGQLKAGASARISVVTQTVPQATVIPAAALLTGSDGATSVITLDASGKPHKVAVKVGIRDGDDVQITDGVKVGDRVVTEGAFELSSEDPDVLAKTSIQVQAPKPAGAGGDDDAK
jgi:HlyD family secretion protein